MGNGRRTYKEHVNSDLLPLVLEIINVRPRHALRRVRQHAFRPQCEAQNTSTRQVPEKYGQKTDQPESSFHFS